MERIVQLKPLENFKLHVWFQDGVNGVVDLSHLAGKPAFKVWDTPHGFESVHISDETHAPTWPGGMDIDPLNLYLKIIGKTFEEYKAFKQNKKSVA